MNDLLHKKPIFNLDKLFQHPHDKKNLVDFSDDSLSQVITNDIEPEKNKDKQKDNLIEKFDNSTNEENLLIVDSSQKTKKDTKKTKGKKRSGKKKYIFNVNIIKIYLENSEVLKENYLKPDKKKSQIEENVNKPNKEDYNILKFNLNSNFNNLNNGIYGNQNQYNYIFNRPNYSFNNILSYNNILYQKLLNFEKIKQQGLMSLANPRNVNSYVYQALLNNNSMNINNINPFSHLNMNINCNFNNYANQNPLLNNCLLSQNIMNLNNANIMNTINHINNYKRKNNQEKYSITFKSKTNDPSIEKISKIKVVTSYVKDNLKTKQENNNNQKKEKNLKNIINLDEIKSGKETRTVVRLNPIPPNYSSFDVSKLIDKYLGVESGKNNRIYKALYTPLCKVIGKNLGYCFVMLVKPKYVIDFYKAFNGTILGKKKCKKPCSVIWGDIQGEDFLKSNEEDPIRKPIIFKDIIQD